MANRQFVLVVVNRDVGEFTIKGPMTDDRPWNNAVVDAQRVGPQPALLQHGRPGAGSRRSGMAGKTRRHSVGRRLDCFAADYQTTAGKLVRDCSRTVASDRRSSSAARARCRPVHAAHLRRHGRERARAYQPENQGSPGREESPRDQAGQSQHQAGRHPLDFRRLARHGAKYANCFRANQ